MKHQLFSLAFALVVLSISSCGIRKDSISGQGSVSGVSFSQAIVDNEQGQLTEFSGEEGLGLIGGTDTASYPASALIGAPWGSNQTMICSATFIGKNVLVTAAHCVSSAVGGGVRYLGNKPVVGKNFYAAFLKAPAATVAITHGASYIGSAINPNSEVSRQHDLAVIIFPKDIAPSTLLVGASRPIVNAAAILVGYGLNALGASYADSFVFRQQKASKVIAVPRIPNFTSLITTNYQGAQIAQGDSGGSLIVAGKLAGVSSTYIVFSDHTMQSCFVDLRSSLSQSLIVRARKAGGKIP